MTFFENMETQTQAHDQQYTETRYGKTAEHRTLEDAPECAVDWKESKRTASTTLSTQAFSKSTPPPLPESIRMFRNIVAVSA
jgi:hypothetical protein